MASRTGAWRGGSPPRGAPVLPCPPPGRPPTDAEPGRRRARRDEAAPSGPGRDPLRKEPSLSAPVRFPTRALLGGEDVVLPPRAPVPGPQSLPRAARSVGGGGAGPREFGRGRPRRGSARPFRGAWGPRRASLARAASPSPSLPPRRTAGRGWGAAGTTPGVTSTGCDNVLSTGDSGAHARTVRPRPRGRASPSSRGKAPPSGRGMIRHSPAPAPRRLPPSALPGPRGGDSGGWGPGEGERDRWGRRRAFEGRPSTAIAGVWDRHMTRSGGPPGSLQGPARGNGPRGERACHGHRAGRGGSSRVTGGRRRPPDDASPRGPGRRPGVLLRHARAGSGRRGEAWMRPPAPRPYGPWGPGSPPSCVEGVGVTLVCDASG